MGILDKIKGSSVYIRDKRDHDVFCDGEGRIVEISAFAPHQSRTRPCGYCKKIFEAREKKLGKSTEHQRVSPVPQEDEFFGN